MATITPKVVNHASVAMTAGTAAVGPDKCLNDGRTILRFTNTNASPINVTIPTVVGCSQGTIHSLVIAVAATTGDVLVGPFPTALFNDASGYLNWTYSAVTDVTVWAIKVTDTGI